MPYSLDDLRLANAALFRRCVTIDGWKFARWRLMSGWMADVLDLIKHNVHATGVGRKFVNGRATKALCVQLFVHRKLPEKLIPRRCRLPKTMEGVPTDVIVSPPVRPCRQALTATIGQCLPPTRPLRPGLSISHPDTDGGSIGCFCTSTQTGADPAQLLSSAITMSWPPAIRLRRGMRPTNRVAIHCGGPAHAVGGLEKYIPLKFDGTGTNRMDCASARLKTGVGASNVLPGGGSLSGPVDPKVDMIVKKTGVRTGMTEGRIISVNYGFVLDYETSTGLRSAKFVDQIRIQVRSGHDFALSGDSGAVVYTCNGGRAVGLLFAATDDGNIGIASPLHPVLAELSLALV